MNNPRLLYGPCLWYTVGAMRGSAFSACRARKAERLTAEKQESAGLAAAAG